jgi:hypothetical protein
MTTLYLHIGMPKAGSTSIQTAFADGQEHLAGHGVGYFDLGKNHSSLLIALFRGEKPKKVPKFFRKMLDRKSRRTGLDKAALVRAFDNALSANCMPKLVMSAEMLFLFKRKHVGAMKEHLSRFFDEIRILAYVRDPISWASSRAQQEILRTKNHRRKTLDEICALEAIAAGESPIVPHYRAGLEPYIEAFGRGAVDIRLFDRNHFMNGDLIADFCVAIGEPSLASSLTSAVQKLSLSYEAVLLLDQYKKLLAARDDQDLPSKAVTFYKRMMGLEGTRFALPQEILERVRAAVADDVVWLRQTMNSEVFEDTYPLEAATGPAWSASTLRQLVEITSAQDLGISAEDLATMISFDPWKKGPTTNRANA